MKIRLTMKTPDCVWNGLKDAGLDPRNPPEDVEDILDKWVAFGEYVTIEIDTETGEAIVIQQ